MFMEGMKKKDGLKLSVAVTSEVFCPRSEMTLLRQRSAVVWEVTGLIPRQQLTAGHVGGRCKEFRQNDSLKTFRMHQFKFWVGEATLAARSLWAATSRRLTILLQDEGAHTTEVLSFGDVCHLVDHELPGGSLVLSKTSPGPCWVLGT